MGGNNENRDASKGCPITRRDFLNGVAVGVGLVAGVSGSAFAAGPDGMASALASEKGADASDQEYFLSKGITQQDARYYPPDLTGMMRGEHPGSFEAMHLLRDHDFWSNTGNIEDTGETYDLVVIGGGISGLAAAYFFRKFTGEDARILILDNHDDFGGHAKRNEFHSNGKLLLGYGGTQSIEAPGRYSQQAIGLLKELGIDVSRFYKDFDRNLYSSFGLREATFFDRETFGTDRLIPGVEINNSASSGEISAPLIDQMPIAPEAKRDLVRLQNDAVNYLPGLAGDQLRAKLIKTSYKDFLLKDAKVHPDIVKLYQQAPHDLYCLGIDAVPALSCHYMGYPGFKGIPMPQTGRHGEEEPYIFHFPDGNSSIARLLVRSLVPGSAPGRTMEDIVTAKMDYTRLDRAENRVRIRLNSTGVRARNISNERGDAAEGREVEVAYFHQGKLYRVRGSFCVMGCYNCVVPYLCPEMPASQKEALSYAVKEPLVYTNVQIRNWAAFQKLGISSAYCPGGYFANLDLDFPVSIGDYQYPSSPEESCIVHVLRTPCKPGLSSKEQYKAGHWELFQTPFATFEANVRDLFGRVLGPGGFDPDRDILAITVNRWPHGYAYEYNPLFEPLDRPQSQRPCVIGRKPFGRITIANSDSDGHAYTNIAIDQGYRAVQEIVAMRNQNASAAAAISEDALNI